MTEAVHAVLRRELRRSDATDFAGIPGGLVRGRSARHRAVALSVVLVVIAVGLGALSTVEQALSIGVFFAALYAVLAWRKPVVASGIWLVLLALIPSWWDVLIPGVGHIGAVNLLGLLLAVSLAVSRYRYTPRALAFTIVASLLVLLLAFDFTVFDVPGYAARDDVILMLVPAFIGLHIGQRLYKLLPVLGAFVGAWAIIEFVFHVHVFEYLPPLSTWSPIQLRGDLERSEASFGQSIALGAFLAMTIPFIHRLSRGRVLVTALILGGTLASFSRSAILSVGLTILICLWLAKSQRGIVPAVLALGAIGGIALLLFTSSSGVNADITGSNVYRIDAIQTTIQTLKPFGVADGAILDPSNGALRFSGFNSVDNAFLLTGLTLGVIPLIFLVMWLFAAVWSVMRRTAQDATAAVVGQTLALGTAALITQWQVFFFFVVGIAIAETVRSRQVPTDALAPIEGPLLTISHPPSRRVSK
jgi:hypothetical protein